MKICNKCGAESAENARYCCECGYELLESAGGKVQLEGLDTKKKNYNKQIIRTIIGVIAFFITYFITQQLIFKSPSIDKALMETASELNKFYPIMLDSLTRLDNIVNLPPKTIQYNYTLGFTKEDVDISMLKSNLESNIINQTRTNPDMQFFRDHDVTIKYYYKDIEGNHLLTITVIPEQYK